MKSHIRELSGHFNFLRTSQAKAYSFRNDVVTRHTIIPISHLCENVSGESLIEETTNSRALWTCQFSDDVSGESLLFKKRRRGTTLPTSTCCEHVSGETPPPHHVGYPTLFA